MGDLVKTGLEFVADNAKGFVDATNDASQAERGFAAESEKAAQTSNKAHGSILDGLKNVATVAAGVTLAAVAALTAVVIKSVTAFSDWAGSLDDVGDVLGTTANESAAFTVAIKGAGGNVEETVGQIAKFTKGLKDSKGKLTETGKLAKQLGIAFEDSNGELLSATEITQNLADKLSVMPDGLEKTDVMMTLLGKSGKSASDVMNALANGGMEAARKKAEALGLAIGDNGVNAAIDMKKSMADLDLVGQGLAVSLGSQLMPIILPLIQQFATWAISVMPQVRDGLQQVGNFITPLIGFIQGLIGQFQAGAQGAGGFVEGLGKLAIVQQISDLFAKAGDVINGVVMGIWAVVQPIFTLIASFIQEHGDEIMAFVQTTWDTIYDIISGALDLINATVVPVLQAIGKFINDNQKEIKDVITVIWNGIQFIINTALGIINGIIQTALKLLKGDWQGAWDQIKATALSVWEGIQKFFGSIPDSLLQIGRDIINGIVNGIRSAADSVWQALKKVVDDAIGAIKRFLGIASPSKVMAGIGANMMAGLIQGWMGNGLVLPAPSVGGMGGGTVRGMASASQMSSNAYSYANSRTYNLNVNSRQSLTGISQEFALMEAMAG